MMVLLVAVGCGLSPGTGHAQSDFPGLPADQPTTSHTQVKARNVLKADVFAPIPWVFVSMLNDRARYFPLIVSYERSLRPRIAVGLEAQMGGIAPSTRRYGAALEGRYYVTLPDGLHWLGGLYAAPRLRYLTTRYDAYLPQPGVIRGDWGGTELLLGQQRPGSVFFLTGLVAEAGIGVGYWFRLRPDFPAASPYDEPFMQPGWQLTARVGLGYRF
ncbi:hypothetical protein [Hymenobacter sp. 102]|uniref:hypothetical protein n=1 Tax=Hymenobacter sp. 102 TaxID=3403152 RepID=UPI003CF11DD7